MALTQVTSAGLKDGEIVNADLHSTAQVALAKLEVIASNKIVGNDSGNAVPKELTAAEVRTIINVEDGATADQTASEILTLIKTVDGSGSGLDADLLDGSTGADYLNASNLSSGSVPAARLDTATTQSAGNNSTKIATTAFVSTAVTNLIGGAPGALDTLNELAAAINDDSSYASTVTTALATKAVLTGSTNNTIATVTGSNTLAGEANLTFDGTNLSLTATDAKIILKDGNNFIQFVNADKNFKFMNAWGAGEFTFHLNGAERLRIASDGEVFIGDGIGTTDRNTVLSVSGGNQDPGGAWSTMGIYSSDSQAQNKGGSLLFGGQDGTTTKQYFAGISGVKENGTSGNYAGKLRFWTRPAGDTPRERVSITSGGLVGINITSPETVLEVQGAQAYGDSASTLATSTSKSAFRVKGANNSSDSLWIGVETSDANPYIQGANGVGNNAKKLLLNPFGGSVGINTTSPEGKFAIDGSVAISSNSVNVSPSGFDLKIRSNTSKLGIHTDNASGTPILELGTGGSTGGQIFTTGTNPLRLGVNSGENFRIHGNGNCGVKSIQPRTDLDVRGTVLIADSLGTHIPNTFPADDVQLMVYTSTAGQPIVNSDCARILLATDATQTGAQGYNGALDFGNSDCSAATGTAEFNWRVASVMSRAAGDTSSTAADGNLEFHTKTSSGSLTKQMEIDQSGRVQKFSQPAFLVEHPNSASNSPKTATDVKNQYLRSFSHVRFNVGSHFSNSTGLFTAPVPGIYSFNVTLTMDNGGGAGHDEDDSAGCYWRVQNNTGTGFYNRTGGNREWHSVNPQYFTESGRELTACFATIEKLNTGATCGWYFSDWDDADTRILTATLSGYLLG